MNLADMDKGSTLGARSGRTQSDEAFTRSVEELKRVLAARPATSPPDFAFGAEAPARSVATGPHARAGTMLLYVAIAAAAAAGLYAYGQMSLSSDRIGAPAAPVVPAPPAESAPPLSDAAVLKQVPPPTIEGELPAPTTEPAPVTTTAFAAAPSADRKPLDAGDIAELQARLRTLGFSPGPVDGVAGPMTMAAIKRYQQSRGRPQTGELSNDTLTALRREPPR